MAPRRWLWPCSDSHVLRLPAYQKPSLHACLVHPEHPDQVLVVDSDDVDYDLHSAKRRRIESIAHAFLNGQPIYIPSATLKGPFPVDKDLSLRHDPLSSPDPRSVSPPPTVTADSFIRRRPEHNPPPKSISPDPAANKSLRFNLPSSAVSAPPTDLPPLPKFIAINKPLLQARHTQNQLPTSTAQSRSFSSPRVRIPNTDFISPSSSPSKHDISPSKAAVLRQRPASSLNQVDKAPSSAYKLQSFKNNKRPIKRVYQAATASDTSPFIYRKNAIQARKTPLSTNRHIVEPEDAFVEPEHMLVEPDTTTRQSKTPVSPQKRHHMLLESSVDVQNVEPPHAPSTAVELERSPQRPRNNFVPAINMSFGQESFGMNFDIVGSLPALSTAYDVINANQCEQQLPTATVAFDLDVKKPTLNNSGVHHKETEAPEAVQCGLDQRVIPDNVVASHTNEEDEMVFGPAISSKVTSDPEDTVMDDLEAEEASADELPYISTQAAMQDAHRALFDASSPLQPPQERFEVPARTPAKQVSSPSPSPVHAITPFHQFNAEFTTDTQAPLPNTQALFDGFYSPIKLSAKKPRAANRPTFAPSIIVEDEDETVASIIDFSQGNIALESPHKEVVPGQNNETTSADQPFSPVQSVFSPREVQDKTAPSPPRDPARLTFSESQSDRSDSPDIILSQKPPASTRESAGPSLPALQLQKESISLSEVLHFVSQRRGIDVDTLLSQATPTSSSRSANKTGHESARASQVKSRSSLSKPGSAQLKHPRSSLRKALPRTRVGQRRSTRISLSQPDYQMDGANDEFETDLDIDGPPATQPHFTFAGSGRSFALASFNVPDDSSTIPDPSLASEHAQQDATPASEKFAFTPGSVLQSTGPMSSFPHAQRQYSSLTDLDSTMPDLPQTFLPPVR
jgi:hypothetical protein